MKAYLRTAKSMASDETKDGAVYAREGRLEWSQTTSSLRSVAASLTARRFFHRQGGTSKNATVRRFCEVSHENKKKGNERYAERAFRLYFRKSANRGANDKEKGAHFVGAPLLSYPNNFEPLAKIIYQNNLVKTRTIQANYMHHKVAKILLHNKDSFLRHIRNGHELSL